MSRSEDKAAYDHRGLIVRSKTSPAGPIILGSLTDSNAVFKE